VLEGDEHDHTGGNNDGARAAAAEVNEYSGGEDNFIYAGSDSDGYDPIDYRIPMLEEKEQEEFWYSSEEENNSDGDEGVGGVEEDGSDDFTLEEMQDWFDQGLADAQEHQRSVDDKRKQAATGKGSTWEDTKTEMLDLNSCGAARAVACSRKCSHKGEHKTCTQVLNTDLIQAARRRVFEGPSRKKMTTFMRDELQQGLVVDDGGKQSFEMRVDGHRVCLNGWRNVYGFNESAVRSNKNRVLVHGGEVDDDFDDEAKSACASVNNSNRGKAADVIGFLTIAITFMGKIVMFDYNRNVS
jgi:hypothetical protein